MLLELLQDFDDGVALEAVRGLARLKVREAREAILARFAERMSKRGQGEFRKMVEKWWRVWIGNGTLKRRPPANHFT